jgi:hypothetical protein
LPIDTGTILGLSLHGLRIRVLQLDPSDERLELHCESRRFEKMPSNPYVQA